MKSTIAAILLALSTHVSAGVGMAFNGLYVSTGDNAAGAITSIRWGGKQFVDNFDHGRQCQSALVLDGKGELENPTEAGAANDGPLTYASSSQLQYEGAWQGSIYTRSMMAYWYPVGGKKLSSTKYEKWLRFPMPNVIEHIAQFTMPANETHTMAQFEALTCYMPLEFRLFYQVDFDAAGVAHASHLPDGDATNYEQPRPVIFCNDSESHCIGVYAPTLPQPQYPAAGHGRWRFWNTVKWNAVWRISNPTPGASYSFRSFIVVGTLQQAQEAMTALRMTYGSGN